MLKKFELGNGGVWFHLYYVDGKLFRIEEHDWREGGAMTTPKGMTVEDFFIERVRDRCATEDFKNKMEDAARKFLLTKD